MPSIEALRETINWALDIINVGEDGWEERYYCIYQIILSKHTLGRRYVTNAFVEALRKEIDNVASVQAWTEDEIQLAKQLLTEDIAPPPPLTTEERQDVERLLSEGFLKTMYKFLKLSAFICGAVAYHFLYNAFRW